MAEFTSSAQVSPTPNQLFQPLLAGQQQQQQNQLQMQQMDLTAADHEQVGRLAAGLLNEPDVAKRGDLYSRGVGMLQSQGLAKYAPPTLPDESTLRLLAAQAIPSIDLYKLQQTKAGLDVILPSGTAPTTGTTGAATPPTGGVATAPSGTIEPAAMTSATAVRDGLIKRGMDPVTAMAFAANKLHESGATLDSGPGDGGASQGNFMWNGDRNTEYQQLYGHTPQGAPLDEQLDFVMHELNGKESNARDAINEAQGVDGKAAAISRYYLRPKDVVGETQRRAATALQLQRQIASTAQPGAPGGATAPGMVTGDATRPDLAPPPPGSTAGIPTPYQASGGGIGAVLGGTARAARPAGPGGAPVVTDQPAGGGVVAGPAGTAVVGQPTPPSAAVPGNVGAINAGITRAGGTPAAAATPEPGWGTVIGSYGPQNQLAPTPPTQPPAPPAAPAQPAPAPPVTTPSRVSPPPAPTVTIPPRVPLPPAPQPMDNRYLTPQDYQDLQRVKAGLATNPNGPQLLQAEIDRRAAANVQRAQTYQAALEKQRADDIATEGLKLQGANTALQYWEKANPNAKITEVGGEIITQDPRDGREIAPRIPINANREDLAAALTVARLGPKIAAADAGTGPPVSPEDRAAYAVQANAYQQFEKVTDPISKQVKSVPTRPLPPTFPGAAGPMPLTEGLSPAQQEIERDPAKAKVADERYGRDSKNVGDLTTGVITAQNDNLRTKEMLDILNNGDFSTGPGSETRTRVSAWFQRWAPASLTGWEKQSTDLKGAAAAQAFQKLAFQGVTTQEKESSPRGGILATQLFQRNNPGLDLLDPANQGLLDMKLIQNQANIDYGRDALAHFTTQETRYGDTHKYDSLEQFNAQWVNQRNPQVFAAAMGAIAGQPAEKWADGLSKDEYARALQIVQRAKPSAVVNGRDGRRLSMQPNQAPNQASPNAKPMPPGFTVVPQ